MVTVKSGFHTRNNSSETVINLGTRPQKIFASPVLGQNV